MVGVAAVKGAKAVSLPLVMGAGSHAQGGMECAARALGRMMQWAVVVGRCM